MQIIRLSAHEGVEVANFASVGVRFTPLTRIGDGGVAVMRVAAGGEIGRETSHHSTERNR